MKVLVPVVCTLCMTIRSPAAQEVAVEFEQVEAELAVPFVEIEQVVLVAVGVAVPTAALRRVRVTVMALPEGAGLLRTFPAAMNPPMGTVQANGTGNQKLELSD